MADTRTGPRLDWRPHLGTAALLALLMLASALAEGLGLVLLVPMLSVLGEAGGGAPAATPAAPWLGRIGASLTLGPLLALFVALVVLRSTINHARSITSQRLEAGVVDSLRARAWSALLHCDWRVLSAMRQADNASLLVGNVDRVGIGVNQGIMAVSNVVTLGGIGLAALAIAPQVALAGLVCGILVLFAYRRMRRRAALLGQGFGEAFSDVYAQLHEGLGALRVIKSFGMEDRASTNLVGAYARLRRAEFTFLRDRGLGQIVLQGGGALVLALLVWLAVTRWHASIAVLLPLVALFVRALPLIGGLQEAWQNWEHARPALDSALGLIATAEAAREPDPEPGLEPPALAREIALAGITVRHAGRPRPALDGVDLVIPAGSIIALAGPSGAGKSTIADLLGGLIAPDEGRIAVDGIALDGGLRRAWRSRVTYVQQEPVLFSGSVRDNLLWALPAAGEAAMADALRQASAGFVLDLPDGLDTRVGEGGRQLSGGERQRIVLARALLRDPALLILDEAASALDSENEAAIADALARLRGRVTIVVIGHRGALAALADRVVALDGGHIVPARG